MVYNDETYVHTSFTVKHSWYNESCKEANVPVNKGDRLITHRPNVCPWSITVFQIGTENL